MVIGLAAQHRQDAADLALELAMQATALREGEYKSCLMHCDLPRRNDLDGRGNLSQEALVQFTRFFLETAVDQVGFMRTLLAPQAIRARVLRWSEQAISDGDLPPKADRVLEALLYQGQLERRAVPGLMDVGERQARRIVSSLFRAGAITATSSRAPLELAFPARLAPDWLPGLFPA